MKKGNLALILCLCMLLTMMPVEILAEGSGGGSGGGNTMSAMTRGARYIEDGDTVHFGPGSWFVIDAHKANNGDDNKMFLFSNDCYGDGEVYFDHIYWKYSSARAWCQNFLTERFNNYEQEAIYATNTEDEYFIYILADDEYRSEMYERYKKYRKYPEDKLENISSEGSSSNLQGDKVFFLSLEEARRRESMEVPFADWALRREASDRGPYYSWFLRSVRGLKRIVLDRFVVHHPEYPNFDKEWPYGLPRTTFYKYVDSDIGGYAVPALNLDIDKVYFASAANGKGSGETGAQALREVSSDRPRDWKMTLYDSSRNGFSVSNPFFVDSTNMLYFDYSGATTGNNEYISALIMEEGSQNVNYYGRILKPNSPTGKASLDLTGIDMTGKKLYIYSEQFNGNNNTDLAGDLRELFLGDKGYAVSFDLENITAEGSDVIFDSDYSATFASARPRIMPTEIRVLVGGEELIASDYTYIRDNEDEGRLTIPKDKITGDIMIEARGKGTYTLEASPTSYGFRFLESGYEDPPFIEIAFKNLGSETLFLNEPTTISGNYDLELSKARLTYGETAGVTVRPKMGLPPGNYDDVLSITATNGLSAHVDILLNVYDLSQSSKQGEIVLGDKIYFGTDGERENKWRVLDPNKTNDGQEGIFLISDGLFSKPGYEGYYKDGVDNKTEMIFGNNSTWQGSTAQSWCQTFYQDNLTPFEQEALMATYKSDKKYTVRNHEGTLTECRPAANILNGDKIFFLSAEEADNPLYGFTDDKARLQQKWHGDNYPYGWWFRSSVSDTEAAYSWVYGSFYFGRANYSEYLLYSPAFNLDSEAILFFTAAVGGKISRDPGNPLLDEIDPGHELKLTLLDESRSGFSANIKEINDDLLTIDYSNAAYGSNEYVSALVKDKDGKIAYYGRIAEIESEEKSNGEALINLSGINMGDKEVYVISEEYNGDKKTDYASPLQPISLSLEDWPVSYSLKNLSTDGALTYPRLGGQTYEAQLSPDLGYSLPDTIRVKVGGKTLIEGRDYSYENGLVTIPAERITGPMRISGRAVSFTYGISIDKDSLDFGSGPLDYNQPDAQTITIENTGQEMVIVDLPGNENYIIEADTGFDSLTNTASLNLGETASFTVQPKPDLPAGTYNTMVTIKGSNNTKASLSLEFSVWNSGDTLFNQLSKGQRFYYGKDGDNPISWTVLDANKASNGDDGMFALSDNGFNAGKTQDEANKWCEDFYNDYLTSSEQASLLATYKREDKYLIQFSIGGGGSAEWHNEPSLVNELKGAHVFPLSYKEVMDSRYGLSNPDTRKAKNNQDWWLRTAVEYQWLVRPFGVKSDGAFAFLRVSDRRGIRPAFNLDKSFLLFASPAEGGKPADLGTSLKVCNYQAAEWKLTVSDSNYDQFIAETLAIDGDVLTVGYLGAVYGPNEYISALIKDKDGKIAYYGRLAKIDALDKVAGQVEVNLAGIDMADKELYVFNEQCNGDKMTDYASELQSVSLTDIAYPVTYDLTNIKSDGYPFYRTDSLGAYTSSLVPDKFYSLPPSIEVTVAGQPLGSQDYTYLPESQGLIINKSAITGPINIKGQGQQLVVYGLKSNKSEHDFGNIYKTVSPWTVDLENTGSMELTVKLPINENYIIEGGNGFDAESETATLGPGSLASFTVIPKDNLEEGDYEGKLLIDTEGDVTSLELTTYFSKWSQAVPRIGHHVYLGMSGEENIKWRILDPDKTSTGSGGVFLMAEDLYDNLAFDKTAPYSSAWKNSNAQSWAENFYEKHITSTEKDAVLRTSKGDDLKGDKVFFLSEDEVTNNDYGFRMDENRIAGYGGSPSSWLLRSPSTVDNSSIGIVKEDGTIGLDNVQSIDNKARPALNLDGGQVLFMIPAIDIGKELGLKGFEGKGELVAIPSDTTEWKLTLYDSRHDSFNCATTGVEGNKLTISCNSELPMGTTNYISAIVKDEKGHITYYGSIIVRYSLTGNELYSCTMELDLPEDFDPDKDEVYLLEEKRNGNETHEKFPNKYLDHNYRANLGSTLRKVSVKEAEAWAVDTDLGEKFETNGDAYYRFEDKNSGKPYTARFSRSDRRYLPDMISVKVGEKTLKAGIDYSYIDGELVIPADSIDGPIKISHHEYSFKAEGIEANGGLDFGRLAPGYNQMPHKTITLEPHGGGAIVNLPTSNNFLIMPIRGFQNGKAELSGSTEASFAIAPKPNLPPGVYDEKISITTEEGEVLSFYATFTVSPSPIAKGSSIYFGDAEWLVLDDNKTNMDTPGLFLMSKGSLWFYPFETGESTGYKTGYYEEILPSEREIVNWQKSSSRIRCQDFYANSLSPLEQAAVISTTKSDPKFFSKLLSDIENRTCFFEEGQEILKGDKIFFLSAEEALNPAYGSIKPGDLMWLRSREINPGRPNIGILVSSGSYIFAEDPYIRSAGAFPGFNLNPDLVIFASPAEGGKAGGVGQVLQAIPSEDPTSWKLTLHDSSRQSFSCVTSKMDIDNKTLTINYSGAVIGDNEYLSALVKDSYGNITHYGRLVKPNRDTGSVDIRLPESFDMDQDTLWVFSDQCNGDKKTDYASALQPVSLDPYSHVIGFDLTAMTKDGLNYHPIGSEEDYTVRLIPDSGYRLPEDITISLGQDTLNENEDYTYDKDSGQLVIRWEKITGPLTISAIANKLAIEVSPSIIDFGKIEPGDPLPEDKTVTITNTGNQEVRLNQPITSGKKITIGNLSAFKLDPGGSANFTIGLKDIDPLPSGTYTETIRVTGNDGISQTISLSFTVWKNDINSKDKIYFGTFDGEPIEWRVLDTNETNDGKKGMLLLSEMTLEDICFQESPTYLYNNANKQIYTLAWQSSMAQAWCKNLYQNNLTGQEQEAVLATTYDNLIEDRIFFLSEDEVKNERYGFPSNGNSDGNRLAKSFSTNGVSSWLIRTFSPTPGYPIIVDKSGRVQPAPPVFHQDISPIFGARPAFNLDKDLILFSTAALNGKVSGPMGSGALRPVNPNKADSFKLTLLDSKRSDFTARTTARAGNLLTITYTGAIQGDNEYISALVRNESGDMTYYGRVSKVSTSEGSIEIRLPSGFDESKDSLYVFNEEYNGDYKSDFSSPIHELSTDAGDWMVSYELEGLQTFDPPYHGKLATEDYRGKLYVELGYGLPVSIEIRVGGSLLGNGYYSYSAETGDIVIPFGQIRGQVTITATGVGSSSGPEIEFSTNSLDFGRLNSNYTPKTQRLTIKNIGKESIILPPPQTENGYFVITADDLDLIKNHILLEAGASTSLKIQPKLGLKEGNHRDTFVMGDNELDLSLTVWSPPISSGHQLYFGSKPIAWNILDPAQTNMGTEGIFLLKDTLAGYRDDLGSSNAAYCSRNVDDFAWQDSLAKEWSGKFYVTNLTPIEKTAVLATYKSDIIGYEAYKRLNGDKMFFLSMEEILNPAYGFDYDGTIDTFNRSRVATLLGQSREYYTRTSIHDSTYHSPKDKTAVVVSARGELMYEDYNPQITLPARPAFNLDWNSIVFLSGAFNGKESGDLGAGALKALSSKKPLQWKATLLDPDRSSFAVNSVEQAGNSLTFNYTGAIPIQPGNASTEYISALLMDSNEEIIYYGNIASPESANGTATIDLSGIDMEGKSLYVMSEQCNGDAMTDYSSPMVPLSFTAPTTSYTLTVNGGTGGGNYASGDTVTITAGQAPEGKIFDKWTSADGVEFANANATSTTFTMLAKAVIVTATYRDIPATVTGVAVTPQTISVEKGKTAQFSATVTGTGSFNNAVTWSVTGGVSGTSINDTGLLTIAIGETATSLTVTATSNADSNISDSSTITVTDLPVVKYELKVNNGTGGGSYALGDAVSITADPAPEGQVFDKWTSADGVEFTDANATSTTFTMLAKAVIVTATYRDIPATVTGVAVTPQTISVEKGKTAQFSATVTGTGSFNNAVTWSVTGGVSGTSINDTGLLTIAIGEIATSLTVTATSNGDTGKSDSALVTVVDAPAIEYLVTVNSGSGGGSYEVGDLVSITADPAPEGQVFDKWTSADGVEFANANVSTTSFVMPAKPVTVTATYKDLPTYTVTVQNDGNGTGTASPATAQAGTEISLTTTPKAGYQFKEWQIVSGTISITDNKFIMPASDVTVKTIFEALPPTISSVTISPKAISVQKGTTKQFTATVTGTGSFDSTVVWSVSGGVSGTSINDTGLLTIAIGETATSLTVTATSNGDNTISDSATVTVSATPVSKYEVKVNDGQGSGEYAEGDTVTITADSAPEGMVFDKWTTGDGVVFADANATTTSFVMPDRAVEVSATYKDQDIPSTIIGVAVTPKSITIEKGKTGQFSATVTGTGSFDSTVVWSVSGGVSGTSINDTGLLTIAIGETATTLTVTATSNGDNTISDSATVTVSATPVSKYEVKVNDGQGSGEYAEGDTVTITADSAPEGMVFDKWTTGDGVVFADANATTTSFVMPDRAVEVSATYKDQDIPSTIIGVAVTPKSITIEKGKTGQFSATVTGTGSFDSTVVWSVSGGVSGTSINDTGLLTIAIGETATSLTVTATLAGDNNISDSATVTVTATEIPITKYEAEVNNGTGGGSYEVGATVIITADTASEDKVFDKWTTTDGVTFADENAAITTFTMPAKSVIVTATYKDIQATITGVAVTPKTISVQKGTTAQFTAIVTGTGSFDNTVIWSISDGSPGTSIDSSGLLTISINEIATSLIVTATLPGDNNISDSATVTVTVTEIPVTKYEVEVNNGTGGGSYEVGATVTITADTAPSGQVFAKWTTADGVAFTNANASTTTFTMPAKAVTVTATYKDKQTNNEDDDTPGGSGSSSSGSSSDIGKDQATVSAANGQVPINYTVSKGIATLSLTTSKINKIIEESKGNEVVIDLSKVKDISAVSLPKKALETFKDAGFDVTLKLPTGTITMDKDAAASIADQSGENLTIELKQVASSTLTDEQKEAIKKDDIVFEINIISGTKKITNFDGSLTFQIPYDGPQPVAVWYLNEKGDLEKLNSIFENGMVTFSTNHLSYYVVGVDETKTEVKWVNPFADVKEDNWFYEAVKYVYENDLMKGTGDNTFSPNEMTTRGMIVTILHRLEDSPSAGANSFSDVEGNKYYANAVAWASENNIVSGYGNGKFGPEDAITREQLATILMNYANYKGYDVSAKADLSKYEDSKEISNWALDAISWANAEGLIQGDGNNLTPTANATRAQVATILNRFIEKNVK